MLTILILAALSLHEKFKFLKPNEQSIVSLGLNSIIDLSFDYPEAQSTLFTGSQWTELRKTFSAKGYQIDKHGDIKENLKEIFSNYKSDRSFRSNWISLYRTTKSFQELYDVEEDKKYEDEDFCLFVFETVLKLIKHHQYLYQDDIDNSEWEFICKIWSPIVIFVLIRVETGRVNS
ncbi:hypothetical protein G6F56_002176 [Rhizopus delemar]|nr:hypothetical protein G6F56_002176 [Rhizopus delemar]